MGKPHKKHAPPKRPAQPAFLSTHSFPVAAALFFAGFVWVFWWQVELRLLYHGGGAIQTFPVFHWGRDLWLDHLRFPGGLSRYVSDLLSQLFYHSWAGALVVTVVAALIFFCTHRVFETLDANTRWRWIGFLPALLLLALYAGYCHSLLAAVNLLAGMGAACLWLRWPSAKPWLRCGTALALAAVLYDVACDAVVVFILLVGAMELHRGRWLLAMAILPLAGLIPLAEGWWLYGLTQKSIWLGLLPFKWDPGLVTRLERGLLVGLCLVVPLSVWAMLLVRRVIRWIPAKAKTPPAQAAVATGSSAWLSMVEIGLPLVALLAVLLGFMDKPLKAVLAVDYFASHRQWPQVLEAAKGNPNNPYVVSAVDRALFHTGRLGYDLPLPQKPDYLLLPLGDPRAHWNKVDLYLDLGSLNMALHHASEAVGFYEARPFLVRRLAVINLALGNTGTAKIYLRALAKIPFHAGWAMDYLRRLEADPGLVQDEEITWLRRFKPPRNELVPMPAERMLANVLEYGVENRMAGEYLVVHAMLARDLQALARNFQRLDAYGWKTLPPLYDEAAVLAAKRVGVEPSQFKPTPSAEAIARYEKFMAAALDAGWNPEASAELLPKEYADTYFYYFCSQR